MPGVPHQYNSRGFYFNRARDAVTANLMVLYFELYSPNLFPAHIEQLFLRLREVQIFELRPAIWNSTLYDQLYARGGNMLQCFRGLKEFRLVRAGRMLDTGSYGINGDNGRNAVKMVDFFERLFMDMKKNSGQHSNYSEVKQPRISIL
jgi:hypothetical protein